MPTCPVCGDGLSPERPRHIVALETDSFARSATDSTDPRQDVTQPNLDYHLCKDCWEEVYDDLTSEDTSPPTTPQSGRNGEN